MKKEVVERKVKFVEAELERMEKGRQTVPVSRICDTIAWLWEWRLITEEKMNELADRAIAVIGGGNVY